MGKIEKLLNIAADSHKMPGWEDSLSFIVDRARGEKQVLSDEDLMQVAGGRIDNSHEYLEKLKGILDNR